ncbi:MAG: hypothetical protein FWD69_05270 [Polyangiaceae bacterium]|nr:hypothetical protein [Polyangiaceae bacterium]
MKSLACVALVAVVGGCASPALRVAEREIASAKDEARATARVRESRQCVVRVDDALRRRMKVHDGAGAEAAMLLLENGKLSEGKARSYLADADDRWRAVGVRMLYESGDGRARRTALIDPSPRVRTSAVRASVRAADPADLDVLFETARVDPEPMLRTDAIGAVSAIARSRRGRAYAGDVALRLRDLWTAGDDALRENVAVAWALSPVFEHGGRAALVVRIAEGRGPGPVAAAGVVLRTASKDEALVASANALVARTILEGSVRDRRNAIFVARLEGSPLDAIRKASTDDDNEVRITALARLLDSPPDHDTARRALEILAGYGVKGTGSDARALDHAARARMALARAGDLRIQAWIEEDLASPSPGKRVAAASALAALGRSGRATPLLADPDPSVRMLAACTMLAAHR